MSEQDRFEELFNPERTTAFTPRKPLTDEEEEQQARREAAEEERDAAAFLSWVETGSFKKFMKWVDDEIRDRLRNAEADALMVGELRFAQAVKDKLDLEASTAREIMYGRSG